MRLSVSRRFTIIILILAALLVSAVTVAITGCGSSTVDPRLLRAESMMEEHPDTALAIVESIDTLSLTSDREKALYGLLLTQAHVKNYIDSDSITIIDRSVRYFEENNFLTELMKSQFYKAYLLSSKGQIISAIPAVMEAYRLSIRLEDDYWRAKCAELKEDLAVQSYLYEEAIQNAKEAAVFYKKVGKILNHRYAICDVALQLGNNAQYSQSIALFDSIKNVVAHEEPIDSGLLSCVFHPLFHMQLYSGNYNDALATLDTIKSLNGLNESSLLMKCGQIDLYLNNGHLKEAENILTSLDPISHMTVLSPNDRASILSRKSRLHKIRGEYAEAYANIDSILKIQNSEVRRLFKQSAAIAQRDYYKSMSQAEQDHSERLRLYIFLLVTALVMLSIIGILLYIIEKKKREIEANDLINNYRKVALEAQEAYKESLDELNSKVNNQHDEIISYLSDIDSLQNLLKEESMNAIKTNSLLYETYKSHWEIIDRLCNEYIEASDSPAIKKIIADNIKKEVDKFSNQERINNIIAIVNHINNGIVDRLKEQCKPFSPKDIEFISLLFAKFSVNAIRMLTGYKKKNVYAKRTRLIERIEKIDAKDKSEFIKNMELKQDKNSCRRGSLKPVDK